MGIQIDRKHCKQHSRPYKSTCAHCGTVVLPHQPMWTWQYWMICAQCELTIYGNRYTEWGRKQLENTKNG